MKTKIKICGLQRKEDIEYINKLKPEYIGLVFCKSRRKVSKEQAKELLKDLDPKIQKVGVFMNQKLEKVEEILDYCGLDILQFHGFENQAYCGSFRKEVWKSFSIEDENSIERLKEYNTDGYLLDSFVKGIPGGSGEAFQWDLLENKKIPNKFILAGGLHSGNVQEAIQRIQPDIVDISSGVETNGYKDYQKIKDFIRKVRS